MDKMGRKKKRNNIGGIVPGEPKQITIAEHIEWLESLEEFARYMNKPEKGKT